MVEQSGVFMILTAYLAHRKGAGEGMVLPGESQDLGHQPDGAVSWFLEEVRYIDVASVGGVLHDELGAD